MRKQKSEVGSWVIYIENWCNCWNSHSLAITHRVRPLQAGNAQGRPIKLEGQLRGRPIVVQYIGASNLLRICGRSTNSSHVFLWCSCYWRQGFHGWIYHLWAEASSVYRPCDSWELEDDFTCLSIDKGISSSRLSVQELEALPRRWWQLRLRAETTAEHFQWQTHSAHSLNCG